MKHIPLTEAYQLLEEASAILIEDQVLFPQLSPLQGKEFHTFLFLDWVDEKKLCYEVEFAEGENQRVAVSGTSLFLKPTDAEDGEDLQITILQEKELE